MAFRKETFGTLENGAVITKYILTNEHGLKAAFTDLGGIWLEMWVPDKHGTLTDVVLGYDEPEKYLHPGRSFWRDRRKKRKPYRQRYLHH